MCSDLPLSALNNRDEGYLTHVLDAKERVILLRVATIQPKDADCETRKLPIGVGDVVWGGITKPATGNIKQITLQGRDSNGRFKVSEVIAAEELKASSAIPVDEPLHPISKQLSSTKQHYLPLRAAWFWSPNSWLGTPQLIFDSQKNLALKRVYITVPVSEGLVQHPEQLRQFLQNAHQHGLQVWATLGDPQAVLEQGRQHFMVLAGAYQVFNGSTGNVHEQLDGLQLDIEPYLLPGYQLNPSTWLQMQAKTVNAVHMVAPSLQLDMVLPFWFDPLHGSSAEMLDDVKESIASITLMNYRTDPEQIREFAEKFLAWGELRQKAVYIALESLVMQEEDQHVYRQAASGELWRFDFKAAPVLLLLQQPVQNLPGEKVYRFSSSRKIDGSSTSFFKQPGALIKLLPVLEEQFGAWSSFAGMALHGLEQQ